MPPGREPSLSSSPSPLLLAFGPLVAVAVAIGGNIGSLSQRFLLDDFQFVDCGPSQQLVYHLLQLVGAFCVLGLLVAGTGVLYFLGCFRFKTPARFDYSAAAAAGAACTESSESTIAVAASRRLLLYECRHHRQDHLCFPPYCAPGGLRSRLFPTVENTPREIEIVVEVADSGAEAGEDREDEPNSSRIADPFFVPFPTSQTSPRRWRTAAKKGDEVPKNRLHRTTNSANNPLDWILRSPYLPLPYLVTKSLEGKQCHWNTLGGSRCSCKRHLLAVERELLERISSSEGETSQGDHSASASKNSGGEGGTLLWGLGIAAQRFVSQAGNFHTSLRVLELIQAELQDPTMSSPAYRNQEKLGLETKDSRNPHKRLPSPQETMTAQRNADPPPPASVKGHVEDPAGKPLPQAVLVYHESAHSIVFRDHLRRQQSAIRRTSYQMERSNHAGGGRGGGNGAPRPASDGALAPPRAASAIMEDPGEASEPDTGYESAGSRGSTQSNRSGYSARSGGEGSSVASGGSGGQHRHRKDGIPRPRRNNGPSASSARPVVIANFQPVVEPLESLDLYSSNVFEPLLAADPLRESVAAEMSAAEKEVVGWLRDERAVVKTIRNADWTAFLQKFKPSEEGGTGTHDCHPAHKTKNASNAKTTSQYPYNSFVTSTSLLPSGARKMRCFGSTNEYAIGVVFALPKAFPEDASEDEAAKRTRTWSWPSGYSAKTEFNIDHHGNLINGREEALVPLSGMRKLNHSYLHDEDYIVGGRVVKGGLTTVPYNEIYVRVGALGRISGGVDVVTGTECDHANGSGRSFDHGIGLPVALFVRSNDYGHLVQLLRTRARYSTFFGSDAAVGIPLLFISPETGVMVFTENLQCQVLKKMSWELNPFQNPSLAYRTGIDNTSEPHLRQKLEELLDLDGDKMKQALTPEEMARIAGGFGATDESVANLLNDAMHADVGGKNGPGHKLQDLVNEGLAFALRANDYHTSRQLLILYTLVASKRENASESKPLLEHSSRNESIGMESGKDKHLFSDERTLDKHNLSKPPPPPLDTDRLRSATNSDGLLAVLGAAQVLRAMQDGSAKRRVKESIDAIEEWIENGEQSVAFRVASWRDQRAAQGDLKIAMENDSNFMAFISNKAISNRKKFAKQLQDAAAVTDFDSLLFLKAIHSVLSQMHSPCLRLELLQYMLGLDNRYSVAHVTRSVELAATCLNLSGSDESNLLE